MNYYIPLLIFPWNSLKAEAPDGELKIHFGAVMSANPNMAGFIPVYKSQKALEKDYPDCEFIKLQSSHDEEITYRDWINRKKLCNYFNCSDSNKKQFPSCQNKNNTLVCKAIHLIETLTEED